MIFKRDEHGLTWWRRMGLYSGADAALKELRERDRNWFVADIVRPEEGVIIVGRGERAKQFRKLLEDFAKDHPIQ